MITSARQEGFTLLEALITAFVLAFGLFGLVAAAGQAQITESEASARSQALTLVGDMSARLSANRGDAAAYVTGTLPAGTGDSQPADCSAFSVGAARDLCDWSNALKGSTEVLSGAPVGGAPQARGCVEPVIGADPLAFRITVVWQGRMPTAAPTSTCGQGLYGLDATRRSVSRVVAVANLMP